VGQADTPDQTAWRTEIGGRVSIRIRCFLKHRLQVFVRLCSTQNAHRVFRRSFAKTGRIRRAWLARRYYPGKPRDGDASALLSEPGPHAGGNLVLNKTAWLLGLLQVRKNAARICSAYGSKRLVTRIVGPAVVISKETGLVPGRREQSCCSSSVDPFPPPPSPPGRFSQDRDALEDIQGSGGDLA